MQLKYKKWDVVLKKDTYIDGSTCLSLVDAHDCSPIARCTAALQNEVPPDGHVFIKDWSENEGMLEFLVKNGVVEDTTDRIPTGFVKVAVCKLLV